MAELAVKVLLTAIMGVRAELVAHLKVVMVEMEDQTQVVAAVAAVQELAELAEMHRELQLVRELQQMEETVVLEIRGALTEALV
jgi:hypothetical protein